MTTTRDKIVAMLDKIPDHTLPRRDLVMRLSYRPDFGQVYQSMLDEKIIEEFGLGIRSNSKKVGLTFQFIHQRS